MNLPRFFASVRENLFGGSLSQQQVDGINAILAEWRISGDGDERKLAYLLATTYHETAKEMWPIEEFGKGRGHAYGLPAGPWQQVYDGRGDVQLTWEANYAKATQRLHGMNRFLDVNLVRDPSAALRLDVAAAVLVVGCLEGWFTGKKLGNYFTAHLEDWVGARAVVNGADRASIIAGYGKVFLSAMN